MQVEFVYKENKNTPRTAFSFNYSLNEPEKIPGTYLLMARLFTQGTINRSAQEIAEELDRYAIEFTAEMKQDFLRFKFVCLNEDFHRAVEITEDIIKNTTFADFEREKAKIKGEIVAELDAPRMKALDSYYKNIFAGHHYGNVHTKILDSIDIITREDVEQAYAGFTENSRKAIVVTGDISHNEAEFAVTDAFGDIPSSKVSSRPAILPINGKKESVIEQAKLNQAHIIQGWLVPTFESDDAPALMLLNNILGAGGLSSRLFLELRDKKGLAYTVRSSYEQSADAANFSIYIGTEPNNIQIAIDGFGQELQKLKDIAVTEQELADAKANLAGKWAFSQETNAQQTILLARNLVLGLGENYNDRLKQRVAAVTADDIRRCANKYFDENFVLSVVKPARLSLDPRQVVRGK